MYDSALTSALTIMFDGDMVDQVVVKEDNGKLVIVVKSIQT